MRLRYGSSLLCLALIAHTTLTQDRGSQRVPIAVGLRGAIESVKKSFFLLDFDQAAQDATEGLKQYPRSVELKAWRIAAMARNRAERESVTGAEQLKRTAPNDPWTYFALGIAYALADDRAEDAVKASARAVELAPKNPDIIWMRATVLRRTDHEEEALRFIAAHLDTAPDKSMLLTERGEALNSMSYGATRDTIKAAEAKAAFEAARKANPANPAPIVSLANAVPRTEADQAVALYEEARRLAPKSYSLAGNYYNAILRRTGISAAEKEKLILPDLEARMAERPDRPALLESALAMYGQLGMLDKKRAVEDRILERFPNSPQAEWVYAGRWRAIRDDEHFATDSSKQRAYVALVKEYLNRPSNAHEGLLSEAYMNLFFQLESDSTANPADLWMAVKGMAAYDKMNLHISRVLGPVALADRKIHLSEAEKIATEGLPLLRKKAEGQRKYAASEGEFIQTRDWMQGLGRNAVGWVYFAQGRTVEAKRELLKAYELSAADVGILNHLGKLYEGENQLDSAEMYYIKGANASTAGVNPNKASLTALYKKRKGSLEGIDTYLASLKDIDRATRRKTILASRLAEPKPVKPFAFKTLDGKEVSLEGLKGKVAVVNFWGLWCGWCVKEMPDFQKLFEQYKSDTSVVILTLDTNDPKIEDVRSWMAKKSFSFPVMLDNGYVEKNNVTAFPTTWFIDPSGRLRFQKVGWSEQLVEEFGWRIEALRAGDVGTQ